MKHLDTDTEPVCIMMPIYYFSTKIKAQCIYEWNGT